MSQHDSGHAVAVYSDYVCPFCYLGKASLSEYLDDADEPPEVEWRPFDLRGQKRGPDGGIREDVDDGKDDAYFEQVRRNVARLKEAYGVEMDLDRAGDVDSWNAQKAAEFVRREHPDRFGAFHDAVFDALWTEGRDIGDLDVLREVAESIGLPGEEIRAAVGDDDLDAELRGRLEEARRAGVEAVPTFVYGDHAARGAVPPDQLRRLVEGT